MVFVEMLKAGRLGWLEHAGDRWFSSSWILYKWWPVFWGIIVPSSPRSTIPCLNENDTVYWNFGNSLPVNSVRASDLAHQRHFKIIHAMLKFFSQPLLVVRREFPYHRWEPIYIGTNEEPLYSEELTWEGQQDKMTQVI